jgi:outer membrane protein OmpA-like peptidoglycan-associated protein
MSKSTLIFAYLLFIIQLSAFQVVGQELHTTSKKAAKYYEDSKEYFRDNKLPKAAELLEKAVELDPSFLEAHFALGNALKMLTKDRPDAAEKYEFHYRKCIELAPEDRKMTPIYFEVAQLDFQQGNYKNAKNKFNKFLSMSMVNNGQTALARKSIASCDYAEAGMKNPVDFKPYEVDAIINAFKLQYFPVLSADQQMMIFTARIGNDIKSDENMYVSKKEGEKWTKPENIQELNTEFNEGTCTISADGKVLIFTVCEGSAKRQVIGSCDLFVSYNVGGKWQEPQNMGANVNSRYWDTQPSLTADGRTLYFISERSGGLGGYDIWRTKRDDEGKWGRAENVRGVNTRANELAPFIHVNGTSLFFSSDGYQNYGGYDLFRSELKNGKWETPSNLGYPINDHRNQMGLFITADGENGYYSHEETRGNTILSSKIYAFELPETMRPAIASNYVKGTVYDAKTKKKLEAKIDLYNLANDSIASTVKSDAQNGDYLIVLNKGSEYALYVSKEGYLFKSLSFNYSEKDGKDVIIDIYLEQIVAGSKITLNNIFFETAKWDLQDKSKTELNRILNFMNENPSIKIEISGHTDDVGSDAANLDLSKKRAQSVVEFLSKMGLPPTRLLSKGYGETQPLNPNSSDENRAMNRRIEFKIL